MKHKTLKIIFSLFDTVYSGGKSTYAELLPLLERINLYDQTNKMIE